MSEEPNAKAELVQAYRECGLSYVADMVELFVPAELTSVCVDLLDESKHASLLMDASIEALRQFRDAVIHYATCRNGPTEVRERAKDECKERARDVLGLMWGRGPSPEELSQAMGD